MSLSRIAAIAAAVASLGVAACASAPLGEPQRMPGLSLAAAHSDFTFTLTSAGRLSARCAARTDCPAPKGQDGAVPTPFAAQVARIAELLQEGARGAYPDLAQRIAGSATGGFDVYVAAADGPGSASSAGGRIALNAGLGDMRPYDEWLAFAIAREMGHVIAGHHEENAAVSIAASVIMNIVLPGSGLVKSAASKVGAELAISSNRDQQAARADAIAISLLEAAGFRLRDVALSLAVAPAWLDENAWSRGFRRSSDKLIAEVRGPKRAGAAGLPPPNDRLYAAAPPDSPQVRASP